VRQISFCETPEVRDVVPEPQHSCGEGGVAAGRLVPTITSKTQHVVVVSAYC